MTLFRSRFARSASAVWARRAVPLRRGTVGVFLAGVAWQEPTGTQPAQPDTTTPPAVAPAQGGDQARASVPWGTGERLDYDVKFGILRVGSASMAVESTETIRGREAYHTVFRVHGGTIFYKVDDRFESWFDTRTLSSLRFVQDQQEGRKEREAHYEIFPERAAYQRQGDEGDFPSVSQPLDDGSFIYYVRTLPLRPGDVYEVNRYFRPDRNPVRIRVLRRERVSVPAGTFDAVVVQPSIKTKGIFAEGGHAEIWFSDDADRVMLQLKSQLPFGSLNLYLKSKREGQKLGP